MASNQRMAHIDLKLGKARSNDIPSPWQRKFLGGRGLSGYLVFQHLPKGINPLKPGNIVVIGAGPLGGSMAGPFQCAGISTKSPLTGLSTYASVPGPFAGEMRWSGFDQLIISGKARHLTYLFIHDSEIEFKDATGLKGKGVSDTLDTIRKELKDDHIRALVVGPAGESQIVFSNIATDCGGVAGRTGVGAVLGGKNIKAIVCRGTQDIVFNQPTNLMAYQKQLLDQLSFQFTASADFDSSQMKKVSEISIQDLALDDSSMKEKDAPGPVTRLITESGLDLFSTRCMLDWMFRLWDAGVITKRKLRSFPQFQKDTKTSLQVITQMLSKKGIGATLALGPFAAAKKLGPASLSYFPSTPHLIRMHTEDTINPFSLSQRKTYFSTTSSISPMQPAFQLEAKSGVMDFPENTSCKKQPTRSIALNEMSEIIANSLGLCRLSILEKSNTHKIFAMYNKLFQMATGLSLNPSELRRIAQRSYAVERLLNIRETPVNGRPASAANLFDTPTGLQMTRSAWENLELKRFRQLVTRKFREQGWDKKLIVKLKVFKDLEIEELWPLMK